MARYSRAARVSYPGFILTWQADGPEGFYTGIYGQRFDKVGSVVGEEFNVNSDILGDKTHPSVTHLSDGMFIVTWQVYRDFNYKGIYGQRYDKLGKVTSDEFRIDTYLDARAGTNFSVKGLSDGGFVVTWTDEREVYCQRFDADGNMVKYDGEFIAEPLVGAMIDGTSGNNTLMAVDGVNLVLGGQGNDNVYLSSSEVWTFPYFAQNIVSGERLSLAGKTKFASVIDGEEDADTLNLTDSIAGDAFFLHDSYSGLHDSLIAVDDGMGRTTVARAISLETINAGDGDDVIDLTSPTFDMGGISMTINGEAGDDTIWAAEGDDELYGGDDDDILFGGEGNDILTGGSGADIFEFKSSNTAQTDSITDYTAEDTLKFYLQSGDSEVSSANLSGGNLSWGNLTIDFGDTPITNFDDLNIAYDYI